MSKITSLKSESSQVDEPLLNWEHWRKDEALVAEHASVDQIRPKISTLSGISKYFALIFANFFLKTASVFTRRQAQVNHSSLNLLKNIAEGLKISEKKLADIQFRLIAMEYRLNRLQEISKQEASPVSLSPKKNRNFDDYYAVFENRFRGSREEIRERLKVYLPYVDAVYKAAPDLDMVDVGCGRGEWLEILKETGMQAIGIDQNHFQLEECAKRGLKTKEADAVQFLRGLNDRTVSLVTGFHILEHLPFEIMIDLIDETLRVLAPGGRAIFETPNPENTHIGACMFYSDPTHIKPLHPEAMKFLFEQRGYYDVEILRLNPPPDALQEDPAVRSADPLIKVLNERFFAARDFAIIARKRHP